MQTHCTHSFVHSIQLGKTTLLVATICRYVSQAMERGEECRLMVSAPTNQAVSVLATRFLATMRHAPPPDMTSSGAAPGTYCKTILVGDADKLLNNNSRSFGEPRGRQEFCKDTERLQSIFLYKWIPAVVEGYERIRSLFAKRSTGYKKSDDTVAILHDLAEALHLRLTCSLRHLSSDVIQLTKDIAAALGAVRHNKENGNSNNSSVGSSIVHKTEKLLSILKEMPSDAVWTQVCRPFHANSIVSHHCPLMTH